jgi:hypothetical protein
MKFVWILCAAMGLAVAVLSGAAIARRFTGIEIEQAGNHIVTAVRTPIGTLPIKGFGSERSLLDSVYPGSLSVSFVSKDFYRGSNSKETKFAQLIVLRYSAKVDQEIVAKWYRGRLGSGFTQCSTWPCEDPLQDEDWTWIVNDRSASRFITFQEKSQDRVRGVELAKDQSQPGVTIISLYDFQLPEPQVAMLRIGPG